jgi:hypothetical protein
VALNHWGARTTKDASALHSAGHANRRTIAPKTAVPRDKDCGHLRLGLLLSSVLSIVIGGRSVVVLGLVRMARGAFVTSGRGRARLFALVASIVTAVTVLVVPVKARADSVSVSNFPAPNAISGACGIAAGADGDGVGVAGEGAGSWSYHAG